MPRPLVPTYTVPKVLGSPVMTLLDPFRGANRIGSSSGYDSLYVIRYRDYYGVGWQLRRAQFWEEHHMPAITILPKSMNEIVKLGN
jgi:hypothetical protein